MSLIAGAPPHPPPNSSSSPRSRGSVSPLGALVIGLAAGVVRGCAVGWRFKPNYDDSLDVVGAHLAGGMVGTVPIGVFAVESMTSRCPPM